MTSPGDTLACWNVQDDDCDDWWCPQSCWWATCVDKTTTFGQNALGGPLLPAGTLVCR